MTETVNYERNNIALNALAVVVAAIERYLGIISLSYKKSAERRYAPKPSYFSTEPGDLVLYQPLYGVADQ
jgi:hypothetical protein